ncbi:MAG: 2'-5' RNA ligase family protein [Saprospiraceae bacterium]
MIRTQLTLFVNKNDSSEIEKVRQKYNPIQYGLIDSHVTLCRENEIENLPQVIRNLLNLNIANISIEFWQVRRFHFDQGVLLPSLGQNHDFQMLRTLVLKNIIDNPSSMEAHITLMHPRNSECNEEIFREIRKNTFPESILFQTIALIQQENGGVWKSVESFQISKY